MFAFRWQLLTLLFQEEFSIDEEDYNSNVLMVIGSFGASITFPGISFADDACSNKGKILTLKPWYSA